MAELKTKTALLDMLAFLTPAIATFVAALWYPTPLLFVTAGTFLLIYMWVTYLRFRG